MIKPLCSLIISMLIGFLLNSEAPELEFVKDSGQVYRLAANAKL